MPVTRRWFLQTQWRFECRAWLVVIGLLWTAGAAATADNRADLKAQLYADPGAAERLLERATADGTVEPVEAELLLAEARYQRNAFGASMQTLAQLEARLDAQTQLLPWARMKLLTAQNLYRLGSPEPALGAVRAAQEVLNRAPDPLLLAQSHNVLAAIELASGDKQAAARSFARSLALFEAEGAWGDVAKLNSNLGAVMIELGALEQARPYLDAALSQALELKRQTTIVTARVNLAELEARRGRFDDARAQLAACFEVLAQAGDSDGRVWCHEAASVVHELAGAPEEAAAAALQALELARSLGLQQHRVDNARRAAGLLVHLGLAEEALTLKDEAFETLMQMRDQLMRLRMDQTEALVEFERTRGEVRALRMREESQQARNRLLLGGLVLLLPLLAASLWLLRSRNRALYVLGSVNERNAMLARTDSLTGLSNRFALRERLQAPQLRPETLLMLLDLDHFKSINDRFGHDAGDAVLRHLGGLLVALLEDDESAGRWGGEEFLVVLGHGRPERARALADALLRGLAQPPERTPASSASMGLSRLGRGPLKTALAAADAALYEAKQGGRARLVEALEAGSDSEHAAQAAADAPTRL